MKKQHKGRGGERLRIRTLSPFDKRAPQQKAGSKEALGLHRHCDGATKRVKSVFEELPSRGFEESLVGTPDTLPNQL
jgi:hypothetical protein